MAIYHLSVKTISRSAGRSATAAAAYRAGDKITDERTGEIHDYTRKGGIESIDIILPSNAPEWASDRSALWNAAEQAETRKNSTVAREFEIALPDELDAEERRRLAVDFARELVDRHGLAADVAIHAPNKHGDEKNHHAHILVSTRRLTADGFTEKTRELDDRKTGEVERWRERFATLQNERLEKNGNAERVDHRSLKAQGIDREPTRHLGPSATGYERRTGEQSRKRFDFEKEVLERLSRAKEIGEIERGIDGLERSIIDLSGDLERFKAERMRITPEQAERVKSQFFAEAREDWRRETVERYTKEGDDLAAHYWGLRKKEPKEPLIFGKTEWKNEHREWVNEIYDTKDRAEAARMAAKDAQEGRFDNKPENRWAWQKKAQERLERERPELAKVLREREQAEREKAALAAARAENDRKADLAISAFKSLAVKREGKFLGYQDGGSKWAAVPAEVKGVVDSFNQHSPAERVAILGHMRENLKRDPEGAAKFREKIERDTSRGRGR